MRSRPLLLLATLALVLAGTTSTAAAHSDEGELELTTFEQTGPRTVEVEVGIVYADEHLAEDATVTATLRGPDGATVGPVDLVRTGDTTSLYGATVELPAPGDWSVDVTSTEPTGQVAGAVTLSEQATTPSQPTASTSTPTTVAPSSLPSEPVADPDAEDDSGVSATTVVLACLVLAAIVIGGAFAVARSRGRTDGPTEPPAIS